MKKSKTNKRKKTILIVAIVAVLVIALIIILAVTGLPGKIYRMIVGDQGPVEPQTTFFEFYPKGEGDMAVISGNVLVADEGGVSCFDKDGKWQWTHELSLEAPVFAESDSGNLAVLADIGGTGMYGFDKNGLTWTYAFPDRIINISDSVVAGKIIVIHRESSYISAATLMEVGEEAKPLAARKFGEYYMMTASISPGGRQAAISGVTQDVGKVTSITVFMKLPSYELFKTEETEGEFLTVASYAGNTSLFLAGGDSVYRAVVQENNSTGGDSKKLLWGRNGGADTVVAVEGSSGRFAVVTTPAGADAGLEAQSKVIVFNASGDVERAFDAEGGIYGVRVKGNRVLLFGENVVYLYTLDGQLIGSCDTISQIYDAEFLTDSAIAVSGSAKMGKVDFK